MSLPELIRAYQEKVELMNENAALKDERSQLQNSVFSVVMQAVSDASKDAAKTEMTGFEIMKLVFETMLMLVSILLVGALGLFIIWNVVSVGAHSIASVFRLLKRWFLRCFVRVKTVELVKAPIPSKLVFVRGQPFIETAKGEYVEIPTQLLGFAAAQTGNAIVKEAAISGSTMFPVNLVPASIVVMLNDNTVVGHGFRVGDWIYTATHVYETLNPDFRFARPPSELQSPDDYKLNYVDIKKSKLEVEDLGYDRLRFTSTNLLGVFARLGVSSGRFKVGSTAHTVKVYTYADNEWLRACGQAKPIGENLGITHTASTMKGSSGSPVFQNNFIVGIHLGYMAKYDSNVAVTTADQDEDFRARIPPQTDPLIEKESYGVSSSNVEGEPLADPRDKYYQRVDEAKGAGLELTKKEKKAAIRAANEGAVREGQKQDRLSEWKSSSSIGNWADLDREGNEDGVSAEAEQVPMSVPSDFHPRPQAKDVKELVKATEKPKEATPKDKPAKAEMKVTRIEKRATSTSSAGLSSLPRPVLKRSETISVALGQPEESKQAPPSPTVKLSRKQRRLANSQNLTSTTTPPEGQSTNAKPSYRELQGQVTKLQQQMDHLTALMEGIGKQVVTTGKVN